MFALDLKTADIGKFLEFPVHMHVLKMTEELNNYVHMCFSIEAYKRTY